MSKTTTALAITAATVGACAAIAALAFASKGLDYWTSKTFMPLSEGVRYKTFEESQSSRDGAVRDLTQYRRDYSSAQSDAQRRAVAAAVVHQFEVYDRSKLPSELQAFYDQMQSQK